MRDATRELERLAVSKIPVGWRLSTVGEACTIRNELRLPLSVEVRAGMTGEFPYYGPTGVLGHINEYRVDGEYALIGEDGDHFLDIDTKPQTLRIRGKCNVNNHAHIVGAGPLCSVDWFFYFFQHRDIYHSLTRQGAGRYKLTKAALERLPIFLPPLPEQRKIAEILRTWDEAIDACERRGLALRKQFEGLRLRLFEAAYSSDNRTRHAKDLFEAVSEKKQTHLPLLAVMQDIGVVRRDELDRRVVMPDGDVDGYKVVREGDFVISLRSFEGGLEYSRVTGLVSPAYTVLRSVGGEYVGDYYRQFFKSKSFIGRLDKLIFGIRDGKQIAFRDFGDMKIPNPPRDEQEAAAEVLGMAEHQIRLAEQEALALQRQKRGLMQKLLTGEWRVKVDA